MTSKNSFRRVYHSIFLLQYFLDAKCFHAYETASRKLVGSVHYFIYETCFQTQDLNTLQIKHTPYFGRLTYNFINVALSSQNWSVRSKKE